MNTRQLGLGMATALVVGNTIGMGIFMQPAALAPYLGGRASIGKPLAEARKGAGAKA